MKTEPTSHWKTGLLVTVFAERDLADKTKNYLINRCPQEEYKHNSILQNMKTMVSSQTSFMIVSGIPSMIHDII